MTLSGKLVTAAVALVLAAVLAASASAATLPRLFTHRAAPAVRVRHRMVQAGCVPVFPPGTLAPQIVAFWPGCWLPGWAERGA